MVAFAPDAKAHMDITESMRNWIAAFAMLLLYPTERVIAVMGLEAVSADRQRACA